MNISIIKGEYMRKFKRYRPTPIILAYDELEATVQAHRVGDDATLKLINGFAAYMNKFKQLIVNGNADITDKDIRLFVGLFMPKEKSAHLHQFRRNLNAVHDMNRTIVTIQDLFKTLTEEEVEQELYVALLTLAARYKSHGNYFHTYVYRAYRYQLHRQLKKTIEPQVASYCDEMYTHEDGDYEVIENQHLLINEPLDEINENWINGLTASDVFYSLTKTQRRILKLYYVDDLTDEEIGDKLGVCRATANRRRLRAIHAIKQQLLDKKVMKQSE